MGMRRKIARKMGYMVAPKLLSMAVRPRKAAMSKAATWAMSRVPQVRRRQTHTRTHAAIGLGAAAVALPIGMWLGRRFLSDSSNRT